MYTKLLSSIFFLMVCAAICGSLRINKHSNKMVTTPQVYTFSMTRKIYNKFVSSPAPCKIVVSTRDLIQENVPRVKPIGVVLQRCPKTIPIMENWTCRSKKSVKVILEVMVDKDGSGLRNHQVSTVEDISCACYPQL